MKNIYYAFAALIIIMSACKKENSVKEEQPLDRPGKVITYHLKNGGEVTVAINSKGEYIVGGDVILSKGQIAYLEYNKIGSAAPRSTFTAEYQKLWSGGIVYYVINDAGNSSTILNAISHWETNTPIRFVLRTSQVNYVDFSGRPDQGSGDSKLGMVGGRQQIRLESSASFTTIVHEIGHAVGLMHEQTRADRDNFIDVNYSNINNQWVSQYNTYNVDGRLGFQIGTFDYNSVMLYRSNVVEARIGGNTSPQMTRKDGSIWGDNFFLSQGDIDGINYLYSPIRLLTNYSNLNESQNDEFNYVASRDVYLSFQHSVTILLLAYRV